MQDLFIKLTKSELTRFELYLDSPFYNNSERMKTLFHYLRNIKPQDVITITGKENIWRAVYPNEKYNEVSARKLISDFNLHLENFLKLIVTEKNDIENQINLAKELNNRNVHKRASRLFYGLESKLNSSFSRDETYYYNLIKLNNELYYVELPESHQKTPARLKENFFLAECFKAFIQLHTYRDYINHVSNMRREESMYNIEDSLNFVSQNIKQIKKEHPNLYIIYETCLFHMTGKEIHIAELQKYIKAISSKLNAEKKRCYYNYLISSYVILINKGQNKRAEIFSLIKEMDKGNFFAPDSTLTDGEFNNAVNTALFLGEVDFAEKFTDKYSSFLHESYMDSTTVLAKAKIYAAKGEKEKALEILSKASSDSPYYFLNIKYLIARLQYELGYELPVKITLTSIREYLRRYRKSIHRESALNFITYMNVLLRNPVPREAAKYKEDAVITILPLKNWFISELEKLSSKKK